MEGLTKEQEHQLKLLKSLAVREDFQSWVKLVADPIIMQLEAELASKDADDMSEAILRGKLKQLNSLKYIFKDVFTQVRENLIESD